MEIIPFKQSPKITDKILFEIETPDANGCFDTNPYKVNQVIIYFIERDFANANLKEYDNVIYNDEKLVKVKQAQELACQIPSVENIEKANKLKSDLEGTSVNTKYYYKESKPVLILGNSIDPAWLSTDVNNAFISNSVDEDGNIQYCKFEFTWEPVGQKEGDYIVCWSWEPNIAGDKLLNHVHFILMADTKENTVIPSHHTDPTKYETLLDRYTPNMFKMLMLDSDKTPQTIDNLNKSVSKGFTFLEDQTNQIIDLFDANVLKESLLTLLGNLFNLKLRSNDPTLWRRQIKNAIPLFKKKGTYTGLKEALSQSGITLNRYAQLWQVVSPYTWQESFIAEGKTLSVVLYYIPILPLDSNNFELHIRYANTESYVSLTEEYISIYINAEGQPILEWAGESASTPITLSKGDIIKVLYKYAEVPNPSAQMLEDYIRTLPLADLRDEIEQSYPPKNWNVRLIESEDVLFNAIVPERHPFQDPVIFGWVRTEFPFSENIYNMEEYNGSSRESTSPCDINKDFFDTCNSCLSSKFNIDVEIENLSDDRIQEALEIINEYTPFHAIIHSLNISGRHLDIIQAPQETINVLLTYKGRDNTIPGNGNNIFIRTMKDGLTTEAITRDMLAESILVDTGNATAYNNKIKIYSPNINLENIGLSYSDNELEILSPAYHAGLYTISEPDTNYATISGSITEPINPAMFTYNLYNKLYNINLSIYQDNTYTFLDPDIRFLDFGVKSTWDVNNDPEYSGGAWQLSISGYGIFTINNILPDGSLLLENDGSPGFDNISLSGLNYTLLNDLSITKSTGTGNLTVDLVGRVEILESGIDDVTSYLQIGDYLMDTSSYPYSLWPIISFSSTNPIHFYIGNYSDGDSVGVTREIRRRILSNTTGSLGYEGLKLITSTNYESDLEINNGQNPPTIPLENNCYKENFLFYISYTYLGDNISNYYTISDIDGTNITLNGLPADWTTITNGGTNIIYSIYKYNKQPIVIAGHNFEFIDRRSNEVISYTVENPEPDPFMMLSVTDTQPAESVYQKEHIKVVIEWKN